MTIGTVPVEGNVKQYYAPRRRLTLFSFLVVLLLFLPPLGGLAYLMTTTPKFTATMIISPLRDDPRLESDNRSSLGAASLSSLVGGRGTALPQTYQQFLTLLKTEELAKELLLDSRVTVTLFPDEGKSDEDKAGPYTLAKRIAGMLSIEEVANTPFYKLSLKHKDREFAEYLLGKIFSTADSLIKTRERQSAADYVAFLSDRLGTETITDQRQSITGLLSRYYSRLMLASIDRPFAAVPVQTPVASPFPTSPTPLLVIVVSLCAGIALSGSALYLRFLVARVRA